MISKAHLDKYEKEVRGSIRQLLDIAKKNQKNKNDFVLLVSNARYESSESYNYLINWSPYTVDNRDVDYRDYHRREFYVNYINSNSALIYDRLPEEAKPTFFRNCTTLEFMIYTHIWESTWLLGTLKQLSNLISNVNYDWHVEDKVPDFDRWRFITNQVRGVFEKYKLKVVDIMKKSYHSQIRNAFAHSDFNYSYPNVKDTIKFLNYSGKDWEYETISYEDWHERFAITILFSHYLLEELMVERHTLGENVFDIVHPDEKNEDTLVHRKIEYHPQQDFFSYVM